MKKVVFCDIDKTLCIGNKISDENTKKINKYINLGGIFVLVSGRGIKYTIDIASKLNGINYIICNNGAVCYDIKEKKIIYNLPININDYNKLCLIASNHKCSIIVNTTTDMYASGYYAKKSIYTKINDINNNMYNKNDVMQLVLSCAKKEEIKKVITEVEKIDGIKIINRHRSLYDELYKEKNNIWIDITNKEANKGYGVLKLSNYLNINLTDTVRIGDDLNDLPMFYDEGVNVAVENAIDNLKDKADIVTNSCNDNGVADTLDSIIQENI